jgi:23S rRNA (guanosine2251-2'-O)-methyltransferase
MSDYIFGKNPVLEALRAGGKIQKIFLQDTLASAVKHQILFEAKKNDVIVRFTARTQLDRLVGSDKVHQGIVAEMETYRYSSLGSILEKARSKDQSPFLIICDEIEDPHNLGAIIRSAECSGAHGLIIPDRRSASVNETIAKTSAGAIHYLPIAQENNLNNCIRDLKENNIWVVGLDEKGVVNYFDFDYSVPLAVVIGNEGHGIRKLVKQNCDQLLRIPLLGQIQSLNASVAAGILFFEIARQRNFPR